MKQAAGRGRDSVGYVACFNLMFVQASGAEVEAAVVVEVPQGQDKFLRNSIVHTNVTKGKDMRVLCE